LVFKKLIEMDKKDIISRFIYAQLIDDGTHNKFAESRDLLLSILDDHPDIFDRCSLVGPDRKGHRALSPRLPTFCKNKIGRRLLRGTKSIFDATRGRQGLMTVAETRCPRYYRLSPNFQA
jgi:hypothetical protein